MTGSVPLQYPPLAGGPFQVSTLFELKILCVSIGGFEYQGDWQTRVDMRLIVGDWSNWTAGSKEF